MLHYEFSQSPPIKEKLAILFLNVSATQHRETGELAPSKSYFRYNGFSDVSAKAALSEYIEWGEEYQFNEKRPNTGTCKSARLTPKGVELLGQLQGISKPTGFHVRNSRTSLKKSNPFAEKAILTHTITPDQDVLRKYLSHEKEYYRNCALWELNNINPDGTRTIYYHRNNNDRYYAMGFSPQIMPADMRKEVYRDYYSYDMEACHHAILSSMFPDKPMLKAYVQNRKAMRKAIAEEANVSIKHVKRMSQAILYGKNVEKDKLTNSETFNEMHKEVKDCVEETGSSGTYGNPHKRLHHILCLKESQIMEKIMERIDVSLLTHDGFYTKEWVDTGWLSRIAYEAGVQVRWEQA